MITPYRSTSGNSRAADAAANAVRPLLLPLVLRGASRNAIADQLNALRVIGPGGMTWTKVNVKRTLVRLRLDDVRASLRSKVS
jgi:hypothetical protein